MTIQTTLISGAGNTFHITYGSEESWRAITETEKKAICREHCKNIPADGFIFLEKNKEKQQNYKWHFYNNDGSNAEMCGNATRCVGHFICNVLKDQNTAWDLETVAGQIKIEKIDSVNFKITMTAIVKLESQKGFFCDTGVPHLVLETEDFDEYKEKLLSARALRNDPSFMPRGTNITYVALDKENSEKLKAVSYERGVEGFTAACGTGAMAAAYYNLTKRSVLKSSVEMPGGTLIMDLTNLNHPTMTGPAIFLGSYFYEFKQTI